MKYFCFVCGLLGSFLILSTVQAAFGDVSSSHPNYESINYVQAKGIVQGYSDGTYQPDSPINRAELTKIIMATNLEAENITNCPVGTIGLSDVAINAWFAPFVCAAKQRNVIKGYPDGTFKPAQNVTFVEAAKIISLGFGQNLAEDTQLWYRPYVNYLSEQKAIPDSINDVAKNITRGEMAEMIYRLHAAVSSRPANEFDDGGDLVPISTESNTSTNLAPVSTGSGSNDDPPAPGGDTGGGETGGGGGQQCPACPFGTIQVGCGNCQPIENPMICKNCPSGYIGQPGNNCACETAYLYEKRFTPEQCGVVKYSCGEGYNNFLNAEYCGCSIQEDILEYWLATDINFKVNSLEEVAPIVHGSFEELSPSALEASLNVKNIVLFFHADWCPSCQATDQEIKDRIFELPPDSIIFRTDFDTETVLREKFEITQQHSIVIINKQNQLAFKQVGFNFDDIIAVLERLDAPEE